MSAEHWEIFKNLKHKLGITKKKEKSKSFVVWNTKTILRLSTQFEENCFHLGMITKLQGTSLIIRQMFLLYLFHAKKGLSEVYVWGIPHLFQSSAGTNRKDRDEGNVKLKTSLRGCKQSTHIHARCILTVSGRSRGASGRFRFPAQSFQASNVALF